jgi:hypothetical protein
MTPTSTIIIALTAFILLLLFSQSPRHHERHHQHYPHHIGGHHGHHGNQGHHDRYY